jgi:PmbA protein
LNKEDICQNLVELCLIEGASDATASVSEGGQCMVRFSNNEITVVDTLKHRSGSIFVNVEGRKASTNLVELDVASLKMAAKKAVAIARAAPPADLYVPLPEGPFSYDPGLLKSPRVDLDPDGPVSWVQEAVAAGLKEGAERMAGSLIVHDGEHTLATSGGVLTTTEGGSLELSIRAFGKGQGSGASVSLATDEDGLEPAATGAAAGRDAKLAEGSVPVEPGEMDTVLGPMVMAQVMNQVGRMASAFYIDTGMSFLANKLDQDLASPAFSLADDPTLADTFGSSAFDAEGLPTQRTVIFDRGVFKSYLHNSTTARKHGTASTANAGLVAPRPFNLVLSPGTNELDSLIRSIDRGLYVTNNWYLRYQNYGTGEFSTIPRDAMFLIKDGELAGSVRDLRLSDNMLRLIKNIESLSRDRRWVRWWEVPTPALAPHALVRGAKFTRSSQ